MICNKITKPVFLYQSSIYSGHLSYKKNLLKKLLKIKNIIGVKEGSWDYKSYVNNYKFFKKIKKEFLVMASGDEHLYPCFKYASDGSQVSLAAITPEKIVELIRLIENKEFSKAKKLDKKLLILAKNIYGKYPPNFATARIKYCLRVLKKIPSDLMRSSISLDTDEKIKLKKSLKALGLKI
jgi:4-hydroxy-tetrahydrodipicolinate synthase